MRNPTNLTQLMRGAGATLLLSFAALSARADYASTVSGFSPVGYWRFNETATAPAQNTISNASLMGSTFTGFVVRDVVSGQPGKVGTSARFSNPGVAAGYCGSKVDVPFSYALNVPGAFSLEFWIKASNLGADATGMSVLSSMMNDFAASSRTGFLVYMNNIGRIEFRQGNGSGYVGTMNTGASAVNTSTFTHVVCSFDGAVSRIYTNGVLANSLTLSAANLAALRRNSQMPFRMGGTPFNGSLSDSPAIAAGGVSGNRGIDAWLDEVAYYNYALSGAQCAAHNAAGATPATYGATILADNPVAYWPMDDAIVTPPLPASYPTMANTGSAGAAADGTLVWGGLSAQNGSGYNGLGAANKAVSLDGANGYVKVGTSASLDITGNITMMAWVKPSAKNFFRDIIARGWDGAYAETFLRISRGGANSGFGSTNFYELGTTDQAVDNYDACYFRVPEGDVGNWVHLAGTWDGAAWKLYRNGQLVSSVTSALGPLITTNNWTIGAQGNADVGGDISGDTGGISTFFSGSIDEPAIFNTALSASDILSIYNAAEVPPVITRSVANPAGFNNSVWPTLFKGGSAMLTVWAEGAPTLGYQWYSNNVPLGVTTTNLSLSNIQVGTPTYSVVVTNGYGSVTSSVTLTIIAAPPVVTTQPISLQRFAGSPFSFSIATSGSVPQTNQWKLGGVDIGGATATTYASTASMLNAGNYTCAVSNEAGNTVSSTATLTVTPSSYAFSAAAMANSPFAYWRLGETSGSVAYDIVGNNNGTYFTATLNQPGYSGIDTNKAALFSGTDSYVGQISGTPGSGINYEGTNASFSIECWANGAEGQGDESSLVAKGTGSDGTTANEQFALDVAFGHYRFMTRGNNNVIYSAEATEGPNGTWQHVVGVYDQSNPADPQMRIYVNGVLSGSGSGRPANLGGIRSSSSLVSLAAKRLGNAVNYNGAFVGTLDEVIIYSSALSAGDVQTHYGAAYGPSLPPSVTVQPKSLTNYAGLNASFSVGAIGTVPLTYQWKKNGVDIGGANSSTYTINGLVLADAGNYSCGITNVNGGLFSGTAVLTVLAAPTATVAIPGLVMHHTFNSTLVDATTRGNDGVAIARSGYVASSNVVGATYTAGVLGNAVSYSSDFGPAAAPGATTTTNTSYITLGSRPDLNFTNSVNFTVAFWVRIPLNFIAGDLPFFGSSVQGLGNQGYCFAPAYGFGNGSGATPATPPLNYGGWGVSLYNSGAAAGSRVYGELGGINDNEWHHMVFVFNRNSQVTIYQDGTNSKSFKISGTSTAAADTVDNNQFATIGQDPTGIYAETGSGDIDDLGVWKKALTPLEAASLFVAGKNGYSFTDAPFSLGMVKSGSNVILTWDVGMLQQATSIAGPWTNIGGAALSPKTEPISGTKFYRIKL